MDLSTAFGLVIALVMMGGALVVLSLGGQSRLHLAGFIDPPALLMVLGGSLAVVMVGFPMRQVASLARLVGRVFWHRAVPPSTVIAQMVSLAETARRDGLLALESRLPEIEDPFLRFGIQMAVDGTQPETIEEVLRTEIDSVAARHRESKKMLDLMGRCGPAFGMIATLLGLIIMLGNLDDPDTIGPAMAVALIGTLYGALLANLICIPFGEKLALQSQEERLAREIVLRGILAIQSGENPRLIEQRLCTFLPHAERPNLYQKAA